MNDLIADLRETFVEHDASFDPTPAAERLRARVYRQRTSRHRRLWAAIGASSTALTGGIVAAVLLLSSGASIAYAGWSAVPTTPTPAAVAAATSFCNTMMARSRASRPDASEPAQAGPLFTGQPVLTDTRGKYVALIYATDGFTDVCITANDGGGSSFHGPAPVVPGADQLSSPHLAGSSAYGFPGSAEAGLPTAGVSPNVQRRMERISKSQKSFGVEEHAFGRAGSDISAVAFSFANGETVEATVQNGWYFAWWPWLSSPTSVQVTTGSGTVTSPMLGDECAQHASSCVFVGPPQN